MVNMHEAGSSDGVVWKAPANRIASDSLIAKNEIIVQKKGNFMN